MTASPTPVLSARRARRAGTTAQGHAAAAMTSYRRMRHQARQIRRSGLQPMMVINRGDALPQTVGVLLLRWAWRHRSELAPAYLALGVLGAGWWLHAARPALVGCRSLRLRSGRRSAERARRQDRPAGADRAPLRGHDHAGGRRMGQPRRRALGPFASPLPQALLIGGPGPCRCRGGRTAAGGRGCR